MKRKFIKKTGFALLLFLTVLICGSIFVYADETKNEKIVYDFYEDGSGKDIISDEVNLNDKNNIAKDKNYYRYNSESNLYRSVNMKISQVGVDLIKEFEGCSLTAYKATSSEQYYTIGYGHYGADVSAGMKITQKQAEDMLKSDLVRFEKNVNDFLSQYSITINQNQFDALVSFTYNLGNIWKKYDTFDLKTYLINGVSKYSDEQVTAAFTRWNRAGGKVLEGLTRRRKAEASLFLHGNTDDCTCSESYAGYYVCTAASALNIRNGHGGSIIGTIPSGAEVYVSKADGHWAHITYKGIKGCASLKYLKKQKVKQVSAMSGVKLAGRAGDALRINWNTNKSASGYIIEQYKGGKWTRIARIANNNTKTYRVERLTCSTTYKFRIRGFNFEHNKPIYGSFSYVSGRTNPKVVTGLRIGGKAKDALRINWNKVNGASGYIVERYDNGRWIRIARIADVNTQTLRISKLKTNTTYKFRIRAFDFDGKTPLYGATVGITGRTQP